MKFEAQFLRVLSGLERENFLECRCNFGYLVSGCVNFCLWKEGILPSRKTFVQLDNGESRRVAVWELNSERASLWGVVMSVR